MTKQWVVFDPMDALAENDDSLTKKLILTRSAVHGALEELRALRLSIPDKHDEITATIERLETIVRMKGI